MKVWGGRTSEAGRVIVVVGSEEENEVRGWRRGIVVDGRLWRRVRKAKVVRWSLSGIVDV